MIIGCAGQDLELSDKEQLPLLNRKAPFLGVTNALLVLMVVCFLVPFALRGSRTAMENMQNDVKNWLPSDYPETQELNWFGKHFMGEQFIVVTWEGCNAVSYTHLTLPTKA